MGVDTREVYFTNDMRNHHASSVLVGDHLYGFSSAILTARGVVAHGRLYLRDQDTISAFDVPSN